MLGVICPPPAVEATAPSAPDEPLHPLFFFLPALTAKPRLARSFSSSPTAAPLLPVTTGQLGVRVGESTAVAGRNDGTVRPPQMGGAACLTSPGAFCDDAEDAARAGQRGGVQGEATAQSSEGPPL